MPNTKLTTLAQLTSSLQTAKSYIDAQDANLSSRIDDVVSTIDGIVATGGEANILEGVKVNGQALTITDKMVDLLIASGEENGTISVNGAAVAITGLAALAYKSEITEDELSEALKASIAAKATNADLEALTIRVGNIEAAGYQNAEQVQTAIQAAIAASGHAHFEEVDAVPAVEDAEENIMYLVMNNETGHYDIYAKVGDAVVLLDDTTVDLSAYAKTADVTAAIQSAIIGLNIDQYATDEDLNGAIERIAAVEALFDSYYTAEQIDEMIAGLEEKDDELSQLIDNVSTRVNDVEENIMRSLDGISYSVDNNTSKINAINDALPTYATDEEAAAAAAAAVANNTASDEDVAAAVEGVFGSSEG